MKRLADRERPVAANPIERAHVSNELADSTGGCNSLVKPLDCRSITRRYSISRRYDEVEYGAPRAIRARPQPAMMRFDDRLADG